MLYKSKHAASGKTLYTSKPLLVSAQQGYVRPGPGKEWFATTTSVWRVDEMLRRRVRDWKRLTGETGHTGERAEVMRQDHDSVYTATYSTFAAPLMEWIILRYGGQLGGKILDAFAGGPPRALVSSIMGHHYHGIEIREKQIDENMEVINRLGLKNVTYYHGDGRFIDIDDDDFDAAITCPPYYNLEVYSDQDNDISNFGSYDEFNGAMWLSAHAHLPRLKPGAFACVVVGGFRDKKGELIDFRGDTILNFREAGFVFWQDIVLSKNFGSAAKRSTNAWRGKKLVPQHETLLIFRKPGWEK